MDGDNKTMLISSSFSFFIFFIIIMLSIISSSGGATSIYVLYGIDSEPTPTTAPSLPGAIIKGPGSSKTGSGPTIQAPGLGIGTGIATAGSSYVAPPTEENEILPPEPTYTERFHGKTAKCLDGNGKDVYINGCTGANDYQQWGLYGDNIKQKATQKCLLSSGSSVYLTDCNTKSEYQKWNIVGDEIRHTKTGKCLDVSENDVDIKGCTGNNLYQTWKTTPVQPPPPPAAEDIYIRSADGDQNQCLDSGSGSDVDLNNCKDGNKYHLWRKNYVDDTWFSLQSLQNQKCIDGGKDKAYTNGCDGNNANQLWKADGGGLYNKGTRRVLDKDRKYSYVADSGKTKWILYPNSTCTGRKEFKKGESLQKCQWIESPNGSNKFILQMDGNLVLYKGGNAKWRAYGNYHGQRVDFQPDGNAVLYETDGKAGWSTSTYTKDSNKMVLQDDGNIIVYDTNGGKTWTSDTWRL